MQTTKRVQHSTTRKNQLYYFIDKTSCGQWAGLTLLNYWELMHSTVLRANGKESLHLLVFSLADSNVYI